MTSSIISSAVGIVKNPVKKNTIKICKKIKQLKISSRPAILYLTLSIFNSSNVNESINQSLQYNNQKLLK